VGVITYPIDRSAPVAVLQGVWVEEEFRNQGIAHALVVEFEHKVQVEGVYRVELFVDIRNKSGQELWDSGGYEVYQERRYKKLT
jgi:ribosomal protein S18 acetylase RimI-like enzyme